VVGPHQQAAAEACPPGDGVEPGDRLGVGVVVDALAGHEVVEVVDLLGVDGEVRRLDAVQPHPGAHDDAGEPHAAHGGPEQVVVGGEGPERAVGGDQVERDDVVAEAADGVVGLAVDVGADRAADRHLPRARQHRHPQAVRQRGAHEGVQRHAPVDVGDAGAGSMPCTRASPVMSRTTPPAFCAGSP
jgi:hypothetical protein